ncbi:MAG TPA: diacylglycerol kinase family protein [Pseudogracilibacillus sp.]|nr:diacylglycerol kinase family protein [Pseudogracilibacillus sp.]
MKENKKSGIGIRFALNGIKEAVLKEGNLRIHLIATIVVLAFAFYLKVSLIEWLFLLLAIQIVIITEMLNSVIERIIDYVKPEIHPQAKVIKDMAAGAVLLAAIFAVITGMMIFLPKLIQL